MSAGRVLEDAAATEAAGAALATSLSGRTGVIALHGELGAGKTTLVRGLLHALGHAGAVRSPTYTLVEPYTLGGMRVLHLDLYRLADAAELDALGLREEVGDALVLVEWPERAARALPAADLDLVLSHDGERRRLAVHAHSPLGEACAQALDN
ncbi:MAG: tRNA (adenosine(37)-N6)-threonylcarbamoyltransferase complex ATPase subunit type 1 TsaE [Xanthomonadaceae bacterium]|nr:tRNA (adenosine(37)-N6)-threonylcarbamoyltransferase complex ATPase subunit type 1 TsaE [Xanthomonadaceae bacterium]